jgi:hypothetical protein
LDPAHNGGRDSGRQPIASDVYRVGLADVRGSDGRRAALAPGARTRWFLELAAVGLGVDPPPADVLELDWVTEVFSETNALTLYVAARGLADEGHAEEALEVLGDACRAQQRSSTERYECAAARADLSDEVA